MNKSIFIILFVAFLGFSDPKSILDQIENGKECKIEYSTSGCFHQYFDTIVIKNNNGIYLIKTKDIKFKKMTIKDIEFYKKFESELFIMKDSGVCTTVDKYKIKYNDKTEEYTDGTCNWEGYFKLKEKIFKKKTSITSR